jgi:hypothetical protein
MTDDRDYDDIAEDLHAMRAEPRPEFARELDGRAASWLRERPRRSLPWLRIAIPAAAAAAIVIAVAVSSGGDGEGGGKLDVAVVAEGETPGGATQGVPGGATGGATGGEAAPDALATPFEREGQTDASGGAFLLPEVEGDTVTVRYLFPAATPASVELAGRDAEVEVGPGPGSLEISTEGLPAGTHDLTISTPVAPPFRTPVDVGG